MTFNDYMESADAPTLTALAKAAGVTVGRLSQLRDSKDWPPGLALTLEEVTGGALDAGALSPLIARARKAGVAA